MPHRNMDPTKIPAAHRVIGSVMGFAFAAVGVMMIGWVWLQPFGMMNPPLFFRLMFSVIALVFVVAGGASGLAAWRGDAVNRFARRAGHSTVEDSTKHGADYRCPNCGATLSDESDVSPSGDVKCAYCRTWFNIHRSVGVG